MFHLASPCQAGSFCPAMAGKIKLRDRACGWLGSGLALAGILIVLPRVAIQAAEPDFSKLPPASSKGVDFVKDVQPILSRHCYSCHGEKKEEAGLRWDVKLLALKG